MKHNIWAVPRKAFCWLDEKRVIVFAPGDVGEQAHCELLDTVSSRYKITPITDIRKPIIYTFLTRFRKMVNT